MDEEQGYLHFYQYHPDHLEMLLVDEKQDGEYSVEDQLRAWEGDPELVLREYAYRRHWDVQEEIESHDFRNLSNPEFDPELNTHFGGTIHLDNERYSFPFRASFPTVADILKNTADRNGDVFVDYRPDYLELAPADSMEKYQLVPELRGNSEVTGTEIVDKITVLDRGSEEPLDRFQVDELAEDHFIEQLQQVEGVDSSMAELLIDEYTNPVTVSWAITSDTPYFENHFGLSAEDMFTEFGEAGVYRNKDSRDAGRKHFPVDRREELREHSHKQSGTDSEQTGEQSGLTEFGNGNGNGGDET